MPFLLSRVKFVDFKLKVPDKILIKLGFILSCSKTSNIDNSFENYSISYYKIM
jgi:hypothetical protein